MSFSSSPMNKTFQYNLTLQEIEENIKKIKEKTKHQKEVEKLEAIIADLKRFVVEKPVATAEEPAEKKQSAVINEPDDLIGIACIEKIDAQNITQDLVDVSRHAKVSLQDSSTAETATAKDESKVQQENLEKVEAPAPKYDRNLENLQIATGACLEVDTSLGRFDRGYLKNHIREAVGITKENPMDLESEKQARAAYAHYEYQKQLVADVIRLNTSELNTKTIPEPLKQDIIGFGNEKLDKTSTRNRQALFDAVKDRNLKVYTEEDIKKIDKDAVKQAKLVMTDIQGPVPQVQSSSYSLNPLRWFSSTQNARRTIVANLTQPTQANNANDTNDTNTHNTVVETAPRRKM